MSRPDRQRLSAVLGLRELVLSGEVRPGERLSELGLVERLNMSRTPVRLALAALEHEGLVRTAPGGGFEVSRFTLTDIADAIEVRGALEGAAARLAAERHRPGGLDRLCGLAAAMDRLFVNGDANALLESYVDLNEAFHAELLALADSPMLERALHQTLCLPFASPNAFVRVQAERPRALEAAQSQHRELLAAIARRDGAAAEAVARAHARLAADNLSFATTSDASGGGQADETDAHEALMNRALFLETPGAPLIVAAAPPVGDPP